MRPGWVLILAAVALALVAGVAAGASWVQVGNGPGHTGAISYEGPQTNDTVFELDLPGRSFGQPALVDGQVYMGTVDGDGSEDRTETAVWRIDVSTGQSEKVLDIDDDSVPRRVRPDTVVTTDVDSPDLVGRELPSGDERWRFNPLPDGPYIGWGYRAAATVGDTLYVPWITYSPASIATTEAGQEPHRATAGVTAFDLGSEKVQWTWSRRATSGDDLEDPPLADTPSDRQAVDVRVSAMGDTVYPYVKIEERVEAANCCAGGANGAEAERIRYELWALDAESKDFLWMRNDTERQYAEVYTGGPDRQVTTGPFDREWGQFTGGKAVASAKSVHIRLDAFQRLNPRTGQVLWESPTGRSDRLKSQGAYAMGRHGDALVAVSPQTVTRIGAKEGDVAWQRTNPETDRVYTAVPMAVDEETAYVPFGSLFDNGDIGIDAVDLETGDIRWTWQPTYEDGSGLSIPSYPVYGPGYMLWAGKDGSVFVVGETEASMGPPDVHQDHYPPMGKPVSVTLTGAEPGAFGPATRYRAYWGDGTATAWQENPTLTHAYEEERTFEARLVVGNNANQTASTTVTMHVGQSPPAPQGVTSTPGPTPDVVTVEWNPPPGADHPFTYRILRANSTEGPYSEVGTTRNTSFTDTDLPEDGTYHYAVESVSRTGSASTSSAQTASQPQPPEPNLAQKAFARENQDMTFGILGIALAVGGGAIGVGRRYRKRSRLQEELEALEEGYVETKDNPGQCEAFLDARKGRARSLLVDGTLTEEQVNVLENRIDELRREMRTGVLDERFQFLPYGMVQSMKGMLADGEISTWERSTLEDLLEEDEALNEAQRERVRGLLERWSEDASGGGVG